MSTARVLFIPAFFGLPSHFIPLLKLYQRLDPGRYEAAFLLPAPTPAQLHSWNLRRFNAHADFYYGGEFLSHFSIRRLATPQTLSVMAELAAYREFAPDIIVDDCSLTTALARQFRVIPRATLVRTGTFAGCSARMPGHRHSAQPAFEFLKPVRGAPFEVPDNPEEYFRSDAHLVPGIRPLENVQEQAAPLAFCGPLLLDESEERIFYSDSLGEFIDRNQGRPLAYVTFGVVSASNAHAQVAECCGDLLRRGFALITNLALAKHLGEAFMTANADRYFFAALLPMHHVCEKVDLVVHVSSSGVYHYPILHSKPAITIGTRYYDREEIAQNLAVRGLSRHLPAPEETDDFCALFGSTIDDFLAARPPFDSLLGQRLRQYGEQMRVISERFDLGAVIDRALAGEHAPA